MVKPTPDPPNLAAINIELKELLSLALLQGLPDKMPHPLPCLHAVTRCLNRARSELQLLELRLSIIDPALAGNPFIGEPLDAMRGQLMLAHVLIDSALSPSAGAPRHE